MANPKDPDNEVLEANPDFQGPAANRGCTDILCMLILLGAWFAMTSIGLVVMGVIENDNLKAGEPARLINGK
jgi:hypothetical protein